jgi:putative ABC transport system permease protein
MRRDVDEELAFHVEMRIRDLIVEGMGRAEAEAEARRQFGDIGEVRRACRRIGIRREGEVGIVDMIDRIRQDIRFAARQFVKTPLVSGLAALTLAVGIGATTIVYTVVDAVVLDAVPFPDSDELYSIRELTPQSDYFSTSDPNYLDWRARQHSFSEIGAYSGGNRTLTGGEQAERVPGMRVTHTILPLLGVETILGRSFRAEEDVPGGPTRVALLSEGYWASRFGEDPDVVGTTLTLDGEPFEVVGVVASDRGLPGAEIFTPLAPNPDSDRGDHRIEAVGRLRAGVSEVDARREMEQIATALAAEYPENSGWGATIVSLRDDRVGDRMSAIGTFLLGAVALILLMACGSVSNMLIARATSRKREMGLRAALGAGRRRIVGQLVTESSLLGLVGGSLGVALAWWGTPLVRALGPGDLERLAQATVDGPVLGVAVAVSILSVLIFGLLPALFLTRGRLFDALRESNPSSSGSRRVRDGLVVAQFALAIVVVLGAGLTVRSFARLQSVDLGFEPEGSLRFDVSLPDGNFSVPERIAFLDRMKERIASLPGVTAIGLTMSSPFSSMRASNHVAAADNMPDRQEDFLPVSWRAVDGGYFPAMGIELLAGRTFGPEDRTPAAEPPDDWQPSVVIDATLADRLWGRLDVVGEEVAWGAPDGPLMRVIGVAEPARDEWVDAPPRPRLYVPYSLFPWPEPSVVVRTGLDPASLVPTIRRTVAELDPSVPVTGVAAVPELLRDAIAWPRFTMQVVGAFGLIALLLAAMGIYGVTTFHVVRRERELGIRVALGADPSRLLRIVLGAGMRLAMVGVVIGVGAALMMTGVIDRILYDMPARDPLTFVLVPLGLTALALIATWIPARRATRVDPRAALVAE